MIRCRLFENKLSIRQRDLEIPQGIKRNPMRSLDQETNQIRIGMRCYPKIVFHLVCISMKHQINARIDRRIDDLGMVRNTMNPVQRIGPKQIIARAGKQIAPFRDGAGPATNDAEANCGAQAALPGNDDIHPRLGKKNFYHAVSGQQLITRWRLTHVLLENYRHGRYLRVNGCSAQSVKKAARPKV